MIQKKTIAMTCLTSAVVLLCIGAPATSWAQSTPSADPHGYGYPPNPYYHMLPKVIPYQEGDPIPPGYRREQRVSRGLVIAGSITFGVTYGAFALVGLIGAGYRNGEIATLLIPVAGPTVLGAIDGTFESVAMGIGFSAIQAGGLAMLFGGLATKKEVLVRHDRGAYQPEILVGPGSIGMAMKF